MSASRIMEEIRKLSPQEIFSLGRMVREMEAKLWDQQMDDDASAGTLEFLFEEAKAERESGGLKEWPVNRTAARFSTNSHGF